MDRRNGLSNLIYLANKLADSIYLDYTINKNLNLLSIRVVSCFTQNLTNKEVLEYSKHLEEYFGKLGKPFITIGLRQPDFYMNESLKCFRGNFAFRRDCVACQKYDKCNKRIRLFYIIRRIVQKMQTIGVVQK